MDLYTNTRAWRAHLLLWLFFLGAVGFAAVGVVGWRSGDPTATEAGLIGAPLLLLFALAMEVYCRRYVTALRLVDGAFALETRSLTGRHRIRGDGTLGERRQDGGLADDASSVVPAVLQGLALLEYRSTENHYHILAVGPRRRRYILDVTEDPAAEARIQRAFAAARRGTSARRPTRRS